MRLSVLRPLEVVRRQALCIALAAIVAAIFWASGQPINLGTLLVRSMVIGNLTIASMEALHFIYWKRRFPFNGLLFLLVVASVLPSVYFISTIAVWWFTPPTPSEPLSQLLRTEWKFLIVATWVFSVFSYLCQI